MTTTSQPGQGRSTAAELAYQAIAPAYDDFTAHHRVDFWLRQLFPLLEGFGLKGDRLLDVGCGTGKSFLPLLDDKWEGSWQITACDISPAMVAIASEKAGDQVQLSVADMRQLPIFGSFDLVMCLDDAINHLLTRGELEEGLGAMRANLDPVTGLLIFDTNTLDSFRTFFAEEDIVERGGRRMIWRGRTDPNASSGVLGEATFEGVPLADGIEPIPPVIHCERHFPEEEIHAALVDTGYEILGTYGHTEDGIPQQPLDEIGHSKAIYIARRSR